MRPLLLLAALLGAVVPFSAQAQPFRSIPDQVKRGMDLVFEKRFVEAEAVLTAASVRYPASPEARYYLGLALFSEDRVEEAVARWQDTLLLDPSFLRARLDLGSAFLDLGRLPEAENQVRQALQQEGGNSSALLLLGRILKAQGKTQEALRALDKARELSPGDLDVLVELAGTYQDQGRNPDALLLFEEAVRAFPGNRSLRFLYGLSLFQAGRLDPAEAEFREAIRLNPEEPSAYYNLGLILIRKKDPRELDKVVGALRSLNPAWSAELEDYWTAQAGNQSSLAGTESAPFRVTLAKGFSFQSQFRRTVKTAFVSLESAGEETHTSEVKETASWSIKDRENGQFIIAVHLQEGTFLLDGVPLEDPLLQSLLGRDLVLGVDERGTVTSLKTEQGDILSEAATRHIRRLWENTLLPSPGGRLAPKTIWGVKRDTELPLVGWIPFPSLFRLDRFEDCGGFRCARVRARILPVSPPPQEDISPTEKALLEKLREGLAAESMEKDIRGEGTFYANPDGGWMSSARLLLTGSQLVEISGENRQMQFTIEESQINK